MTMKNIKQALIAIILFLGISQTAFAITQTSITVGQTGAQSDGTIVYVAISPNPSNCQWSGVYFYEQTELNKTLAIALTAKALGNSVRIDFTQPGGANTECFGDNIFLE